MIRRTFIPLLMVAGPTASLALAPGGAIDVLARTPALALQQKPGRTVAKRSGATGD